MYKKGRITASQQHTGPPVTHDQSVVTGWGAASSKTSLRAGRRSMPPLVRMSATRTAPSGPKNTLTTLPRGHRPRGRLGSAISTTSPSARLDVLLVGSPLGRSVGKYSRSHRAQNRSASRKVLRQSHLRSKSASVSDDVHGTTDEVPRMKWNGVMASGESGEDVT